MASYFYLRVNLIVLSTILTKSFSKDTALLLLRVITGTVLIHHGFEKTANIENFADAFVRPLHLPFPIFLSYVAAFSEIGGSWLLIIGLATRFGALAIVGTISVAIYHGVVTSGGFNIYILELLLLYFAAAGCITLTGPGIFSLDEVIIRILKSESEEIEVATLTINKKSGNLKVEELKEVKKEGFFRFLQSNLLSETSS